MEKSKLIICPNEEKLKILLELNGDKKLYPIKFMTKKEYLNNYYFSYDDEAIYYLMKKYQFNIDVCKVYLSNLYVVDINKKYNNEKLEFLKKLKIELIDNKLLSFNNGFLEYLKDKDIEVRNYYDLDLYEEEALNYKNEITSGNIEGPVYEFNTMEDEVSFVCEKIVELLNSGININKISLCNVSDDYFYTLKRIFGYYKIPINIPFKNSIYSTKVVKDYLDNGILDLDDINKYGINKKLINNISSIDDSISREILINNLKNTYISNVKYTNAINIKNLKNEEFLDSEYVFVLGFNQDVLPNNYKDIEYISDKEKSEVNMYPTDYLNKREKDTIIYLLSKIKNLYLSYKLTSPFTAFYGSSLIEELNLKVIKNYKSSFKYSNFYNELLLGDMLDKYNLYGEKDECLGKLYNTYTIPYNTYDNKFTGINNDTYLTNLAYPLKISYTSLNSYNECAFKYYLKYVLKIEEFESTFPAFVGSLYHEILSLYRKTNFDLEIEFNNYLEKRELSLKEKLLLVRIKKDLIKFIEVLRKQEEYTSYKDELYEKKVEVDLNKKVSVKFIGFIDKIMYYKNIEDTYFSIVDYKTGTIDTHIESMKYGLHMQLPVYLYLIHYGRCFTNPIFTGIYYQNILFNYPTFDEKLEKTLKDRYLLKGYSTDDINVLNKFDSTYKSSELIKSMSYSDEKGFSRYTKLINNDTMYNLIKFTKNEIDTKTDKILEGDFSINPKVYDKESACKFCSFKDICFMKDKDVKYLEKVDSLDFLGGEE
ncbi:MAG: PD-(D/E)XK nuclease family protein [Bacilli bacterium]|nr:PD-(D/E)XK nuclease family protein [Bacilli bacterium]